MKSWASDENHELHICSGDAWSDEERISKALAGQIVSLNLQKSLHLQLDQFHLQICWGLHRPRPNLPHHRVLSTRQSAGVNFHFHTFTFTLSHFHFHTFTLSLLHRHIIVRCAWSTVPPSTLSCATARCSLLWLFSFSLFQNPFSDSQN